MNIVLIRGFEVFSGSYSGYFSFT